MEIKPTSFARYADLANRERRRARRNRIVAVVMFVVAGIFAALGVFFLVATGKPTALITISSAIIIASSAVTVRGTARLQEDSARRFDRLSHELFKAVSK